MKLVAKNYLVSVLAGDGKRAKYMAIRAHGIQRLAHVGSKKYIRYVARKLYGVKFDEAKAKG